MGSNGRSFRELTLAVVAAVLLDGPQLSLATLCAARLQSAGGRRGGGEADDPIERCLNGLLLRREAAEITLAAALATRACLPRIFRAAGFVRHEFVAALFGLHGLHHALAEVKIGADLVP